jgi:hypothetical protein
MKTNARKYFMAVANNATLPMWKVTTRTGWCKVRAATHGEAIDRANALGFREEDVLSCVLQS